MKPNGHVKIILPCANEGEWLRVTVDSLLEHTDYPSFEIVVAANGDRSTDFSFMGRPAYRKVSLHRTEKALGVGNGRNVAATPGDAAYYAFLDAHCLVDQPDWLQRCVDAIGQHSDVSMVQPEVAAFTYDEEVEPNQRIDSSQVRVQHLEYGTRWCWPYDDASQVVETLTLKRSQEAFEAMSGAGMAIVACADTFHELGGFDREVQGWFHETMDYCIRAWLRGYKMIVEPNARVYHRGKTKPPDYARTHFHMIHGTMRTAYKYLSPRRRDMAENLFRQRGFGTEVDVAVGLVRQGKWLTERVEHLRQRVQDDDWLFSRFEVYEEPLFGV